MFLFVYQKFYFFPFLLFLYNYPAGCIWLLQFGIHLHKFLPYRLHCSNDTLPSYLFLFFSIHYLVHPMIDATCHQSIPVILSSKVFSLALNKKNLQSSCRQLQMELRNIQNVLTVILLSILVIMYL